MRYRIWIATIGVLLAGCGAPAAAVPAALPTARMHLAPTQPIVAPSPAATHAPAPTPAKAALATPAPVAVPTRTPDDTAALREALLVSEVNKVRVSQGLEAYLSNPVLSRVARAHSCDLAAHAMISHVSSDGRTLAERLAGSDPPWEWPSESIGAGSDDPAVIVAMWMDEPPEGWHRRNILDLDQREIGAGYCVNPDDPSGNRFYWTADFSRHPQG